MKVTARIVAQYQDKGRLKAIATVCLEDMFLITGVRIVECKKGMAVFMPSRKAGDQYLDICFPIKNHLYQQIKGIVMEAYTKV